MKNTTKSIKTRLTAMFMVLTMLMPLIGAMPIAQAEQTTQNQNSGDGVMLRKSAVPHTGEDGKPDGTVDIIIDAYTTGTVVSQATATPSDILLVLDVSGSMDYDHELYTYTYGEALGTTYEQGFIFTTTYYGFRTGVDCFIKLEDEYIQLSRKGDDSGNFIYYGYTDKNGTIHYVYPKMADGINYGSRTREFDYPEVQFYTRTSTNSNNNTTRIEEMKKSVNAFIDQTLQMNAGITDDSEKHRMAIIKYANNSYYSGSGSTTDVTKAVTGNNKDSNDYNYTQLVHDFDVVDAEGDASLKASVNALSTGGATAVDYGVRLAQSVLNNRTAQEKADRNEVVIVFSDGDPTHSSGYSQTVANSAIETTLALKNAGVQIYTLSILEHSNGSALGDDQSNKFMHYLSSNYPDAQGMPAEDATPEEEAELVGIGSPYNGFYMTPNQEQNLTRIFEKIMQNIGKPNISLGTDTIVADALSPYFDLNYAVSPSDSVTIKTIRKVAPAESETPYVFDETVDPNIQVTIEQSTRQENRQILVTGFDFDANYITNSEKPDGSYGRILRITINVKPNYDAIDGINPKVAEIPTNLEVGPASIINPNQAEPIATTSSPTIILNKVRYEVDGESFNSGAYDVYRLAGSVGNETIFNPTKEGHTFSGWSSDDVTLVNGAEPTDPKTFTMPANPAKDIVIKGTFTKNKYNITYKYEGNVPANASPQDPTPYNKIGYEYDSEYTIQCNVTAPSGYTFSGWSSDKVNISDNKFRMPASDVTLVGSFTANGDTPFTIQHWLENLDGTYSLEDSYPDKGETDKEVTATPNAYEGFTYYPEHTNTLTSGKIKGDGTLVLQLYYKRNNTYKVTYIYDGTVPAGAPSAPAEMTSCKFEQNITVAQPVNVAGYTFRGWTSSDVSATNGETFKMPAKDVTFVGSFTANGDTPYTVEYYFEDIEGGYPETPTYSHSDSGTTDTKASVTPPPATGFIFDEDNENNKLEGIITGDGKLVLKLYYERIKKTITYTYEGVLNPDPEFEQLPQVQVDVPYGKTIRVEDIPRIDGYDFVGWASEQVTAVDGQFTMPAKDVVFRGHFVAHTGIEYVIERYLQNTDGGYPEHYVHGETLADNYVKTDAGEIYVEVHKGTHGEEVFATRRSFEGFVYDPVTTEKQQESNVHIVSEGPDAGMLEGTVDENNTLVLRVYYKRIPHKVTYSYIGIIPEGANEKLPEAVAEFPYGKTFTIAEDVELSGYDFNGWFSTELGVYQDTVDFVMPNHDVELVGRFIPRDDTKYTVKHIGQNLEDDLYETLLYEDELTGTTDSVVTAVPKEFEGYTFNSDRTGTENKGTIKANGTTVLYVYYSRDIHKVSYEYIGSYPVTAPDINTYNTEVDDDLTRYSGKYKFGKTVTIKADPDVAGYTFNGWESFGKTVKADDTSFTMPDVDVQLRGQFTPNDDTAYKVEHYIQNKGENAGYSLHKSVTLTGVTDTKVTALPIEIIGYTYDSDNANEVKTGTVSGDGSLVLKLYYNRYPIYTVTYHFTGTVPTGVSLPPAEYGFIQGEEVEVATFTVPDGYTFSGWTSYGGAVQPTDTKFIMPARNVDLYGSFTPMATKYKVEHWLQKDGETYELKDTDTFDAKVDDDVIGSPKTYTGYNFVLSKSTDKGKVSLMTDDPESGLTLKLYYDKVPYKVTYTYYGVQPIARESLPPLPEETHNNYLGDEIILAQKPEKDGYIFQGWYSSDVTVEPGENGFTMPERNVILMGRFVPATNTPYKVEHYIGSGDSLSGYTLHSTQEGDEFIGTTGETVTATPIEISGYTYYEGHPETIKEGFIWAEPMLVLKLFYKKNSPGGGGGGGSSNGTLEITKKVSAPEDFDGAKDSYTFSLYRDMSGVEKYYKDIEVIVGKTNRFSLPAGTYIIKEKNAEVDGYSVKLNTGLVDNKIEVEWNKTVELDFENVYTEKESMLEKDDHFAYIVGYPDGNVKPNASITRAEVATIFFRMMTDEARASYRKTANDFPDVQKSDWFNVAISTLTNAKILDGYPDGYFRPNAPITRAELSKIAASFYKSQPDDTVNFTDISGHWAEKFIESAHSYGFIDGYPDGSFKPDQQITRAETMKIVNRALDRMPNKDHLHDDMIKWPDNADKDSWYYADVQEATNSHDYDKNGEYEIWKKILPTRDWTALEVTE